MTNKKYDGIVVGSGPNGLAAAITLQQAGLSVLVVEAKETIGGGTRSAELTLPGYVHDVCSAIHPLAVSSPFFKQLPLKDHGLEFIHPDIAAAHPFDNGQAAALYSSVEQTARSLGKDETTYRNLMGPFVASWEKLLPDVLGPLHFPKHPISLARFGLKALPSAVRTGRRFRTEKARGLWAGMAAHAMLPLTHAVYFCYRANLAGGRPHLTDGHFPEGGSQMISDALADYFIAGGGEIETSFHVRSIGQLPKARTVLFDVTPKQLLEIAGNRFSAVYRKPIEYVTVTAWACSRSTGHLRSDSIHGFGMQESRYSSPGRKTGRSRRLRKPYLSRQNPGKAFYVASPTEPVRSHTGAYRKTDSLGVLPCAARFNGGYDRKNRAAGRTICPRLPGI